jgi:site-specific recombinase XerD
MPSDQLPLFRRKTFGVIQTQTVTLQAPTPENTVLQTLPAYYAYLQSGGYSQYTPDDFCSDVKKFGLFLRDVPLKTVRVQEIRQWIATLKSQEHLTEKTISRKLSALSNYFLWLVGEQVLTANPMASIVNRKVTSPLPEILFDDECERLLTAASTDPRTYLVVLLLLETGMKFEELLDLQVSHIDMSNKYAPEVWVKHTGKKMKKDRKLKLPVDIVPVLRDYLQEYQVTDKLFPYTQRFLRYVLHAGAVNAKITKQVSAQMLRDTCAVRHLKKGEDIETVLRKLGLSETTWEDAKEKYLKLISRAL